jgi:hypothetical protein
MAESKRTFQAARMDKDIDDRLLKSGQYRDGLNISIDTSEDANVGAIENLKGNELILNQDIYGLSSTTNPNAKVVGSYSHPEEEKIYYFVTGDSADGIFEHDIKANKVNTIVIDSLVPNLADTKEITCSDISAVGSIAQDGTIFVSSKLGDTKVVTNKFNVNATGSGVSKSITTETEVPSIYKNGGEQVVCTIQATQPSITAPDVVTKGPSNITNVSAKVNGLLTNDSVNVTAQGFYYGYKTDGSVLTLDELKNGGTGVTRYTITISSPNIKNDFSGDLVNLVADKQISYATFATNAVGTTDGEIKNLTTASTVYSITGLGFNNTSISNLGGIEVFEVTGIEGAQYTLTGSVGATALSGTHTIGASGSNTHNITISAQGTGDPAREPRVDVTAGAATVFLPTNLQAFDTIQQAAGAAQTYHLLVGVNGGGGPTIPNATLKSTASVTGATYTGMNVNLPAGSSGTEEFFIFPDAGYQFADTSTVTVDDGFNNTLFLGVPNITRGVNSSGHSYIRVSFAYSNTPSNNFSYALNISATPAVVSTTWTQGLWTTSTNPSVAISPTSDRSISFTGTGTKTASDTITVTDSNKYISSVNSTTKNATYGGDLITVAYSGIPTSTGGSFTVNFSIAIPADQRKNITYSNPPIGISLAGATVAPPPPPSYLHTLNYSIGGSNWSLRGSTNPTFSTVTSTQASLTQGATWFSSTIYAHPNQGYKFTSASDISISGLPSWASVSRNLVTTSTGSYIAITVSFTGQSSAVTATATVTGSPGQAVITFNSKMITFGHSNYTGSASPLSVGAGQTFTGPGPHTITFSTTANGVTPGSAIYNERSNGPHISYTSGTTSISGTTVSVTLTLSQPFRKDKTYTTTQSIASVDLYD